MTDLKVVGGGPRGPEGSILEQRVAAALETRVGRIETKVDRIDAALARLEPAIREIAGRLSDLNAKVAGIEGRLAAIEGRLSQIPNVWQTIAILATLLIGLSGILFTAARFLHP